MRSSDLHVTCVALMLVRHSVRPFPITILPVSLPRIDRPLGCQVLYRAPPASPGASVKRSATETGKVSPISDFILRFSFGVVNAFEVLLGNFCDLLSEM